MCYWNLNSINPHGYAKVSLLKTYIIAQIMDIACLLKILTLATIV